MKQTRGLRWSRIALIAGLVPLAIGAGLLAYSYVTRPITLTIAAGSIDGETARVLSNIAGRLASTNAHVRLKVVDTATAFEASQAFSASQVDLAVVRADTADLSAARTIALVTHVVVMILVPPGSAIKDVKDFKGKAVGVVGGVANHPVVELLSRDYDLVRANVQFKDLAPEEAQKALQSKQVSALLVAIPLTEKYLSIVRNFARPIGKQKAGLIPIESAGAIATIARAYESYELSKGTLSGSPPIPDDDMTTLRVPIYLVANRKLGDNIVTELTQAIYDTRRELLGAYPLLAQISAPSTEKDAVIPIHPGAAAYYDGAQKTFFEKYGDYLFYGPMLLGALTSFFAAAWRFVKIGGYEETTSPLDPLYALVPRIRDAHSEADLATIEEEIDSVLKAELAKCTKGDVDAVDTGALSLAAHRLEHLINFRRGTFGGRTISTA